MNKSNLYSAIAVTVMVTTVPTDASAALNALNLEEGIYTCPFGGTFPSCNYGLSTVSTGSYFGFDTNGDGTFQQQERTAMQITNTLDFNNLTPATGSHSGSIDGSESPAFNIWEFFGSVGMHYLTSPIVDNGDGTLDMSGWSITWNGIALIPMGGDSANFPEDTGLGTISCGACNDGDAFTLDFYAHVPIGDASGFGGVGYLAHLEGTINQPDLTIDIAGGPVQECSATNGNLISATADVTLDPSDSISSIAWTLDGVNAGSSLSFNQFVELGTHQIEVNVITMNGSTFTAVKSLTIEDTQAPIVTAQFTEKLSGTPVSTMQLKDNFLAIQADGVSDVCDPAASVTSVMYGTPSANGSFFASYGYQGGFVIPQPQLDLRVEVKDASGNTAVERVVLSAP